MALESSPRPNAAVVAFSFSAVVVAAAVLYAIARVQGDFLFRDWLSSALVLLGPGAFLSGFVYLTAANAMKRATRMGDAYRMMRCAAISFLISAIVVWLVYGAWIP